MDTINTDAQKAALVSWKETHFEVVQFITGHRIKTGYRIKTDGKSRSVINDTHATSGTGGLYELAEDWTNEFEQLHAGRQWDGEFFDEIEEFCNLKNQSL